MSSLSSFANVDMHPEFGRHPEFEGHPEFAAYWLENRHKDLSGTKLMIQPPYYMLTSFTVVSERVSSALRHFGGDRAKASAYFGWASKPLFQMVEAKHQYCPSRQEFFERLLSTDYNRGNELVSLEAFCGGANMPVMLLGHERGIEYKLIPGNRLQPHKTNWSDKRPMMPHNVLGVNFNVEPRAVSTGPVGRRRRNMNFSEESTQSTESDDYNANEFQILHQIGSVMYYDGDFSAVKGTPAENDSQNWRDSRFALVSDVTSGKPKGVWLAFDFHPYERTACEHIPIGDDDEWGWLPEPEGDSWPDQDGEDDQCSFVKIADSLQDLDRDFKFKMEQHVRHEVELVPAVQAADGHLLRQTIGEQR